MGYTTLFQGEVKVTPPLRSLADLMDVPHDLDGYCQWVVTEGGNIAWDGGEKFYDYEAWLRAIAEYLAAQGRYLHGIVHYHGENFEDHGILAVLNNTVVKVPNGYRDLTRKLLMGIHAQFKTFNWAGFTDEEMVLAAAARMPGADEIA